MDNNQLQSLAKLVYEHYGINYFSNLTSLEMKVTRRLKQLNMTSLDHYLPFLQEHNLEWTILVELLTINETYFYREEKQLHAYISSVVPLLKQQNSDKINVWSAGCSSGEEAYSLAIMALEDGFNHDDIQIVATDINKKVLQMGQEAVYNKQSLSFRRIPAWWLNQYFDDLGSSYQVKSAIKNMVSFNYYNLLDLSYKASLVKYDIIFCRNVLIYFDDKTISQILNGFYRSLKPGGYLFLGHTETMTKDVAGFKLLHNQGTFYYRKEV